MAIIERIDAPQVAKLVREILKENWPDVKFSVRSSRFAGGEAVDVQWMDGPTWQQVQHVINFLEGRDFDGMTDSTSYREPMVYKGRIIQTSCFVQAQRSESAAFLRTALADYAKEALADAAPHLGSIEVREGRSGGGWYEWKGAGPEPQLQSTYWLTQEIGRHARNLSAADLAERTSGRHYAGAAQDERAEAVASESQDRPAMSNPEGPATSRQLWALHCITKRDTRGWALTKAQASELIDRAKGGEDISGSLPA